MKSRRDLEAKGFKGFCTVNDLRTNGLSGIPSVSGVYAVVRERSPEPMEFLSCSPAGWFKGKDPTLPVAALKDRWVEGAEILYIGKAGGGGSRPDRTLRARIAELLSFGAGVPCAHWGGRSVWQIEGSENLLVAWVEATDPVSLERSLIRDFKDQNNGQRPFANRQG